MRGLTVGKKLVISWGKFKRNKVDFLMFQCGSTHERSVHFSWRTHERDHWNGVPKARAARWV